MRLARSPFIRHGDTACTSGTEIVTDPAVTDAILTGHVEQVMGMAVSFASADPLPASGFTVACDWLHWVEEVFSTFRPDSEISRIQRGEVDPQDAHPLVREILDLCDDLFVRYGVFDPYARGNLDPAGVVKGWAVEQAALLLEGEGLRNLTINAGGDIVVRDERSPRRPWSTGVRNPLRADEIVKLVPHTGPTRAIATSGAYERGQHVVDTRTDGPVQVCRSATVTGPDLTFADAYATMVFVMGEAGLHWLMQEAADTRATSWSTAPARCPPPAWPDFQLGARGDLRAHELRSNTHLPVTSLLAMARPNRPLYAPGALNGCSVLNAEPCRSDATTTLTTGTT